MDDDVVIGFEFFVGVIIALLTGIISTVIGGLMLGVFLGQLPKDIYTYNMIAKISMWSIGVLLFYGGMMALFLHTFRKTRAKDKERRRQKSLSIKSDLSVVLPFQNDFLFRGATLTEEERKMWTQAKLNALAMSEILNTKDFNKGK